MEIITREWIHRNDTDKIPVKHPAKLGCKSKGLLPQAPAIEVRVKDLPLIDDETCCCWGLRATVWNFYSPRGFPLGLAAFTRVQNNIAAFGMKLVDGYQHAILCCKLTRGCAVVCRENHIALLIELVRVKKCITNGRLFVVSEDVTRGFPPIRTIRMDISEKKMRSSVSLLHDQQEEKDAALLSHKRRRNRSLTYNPLPPPGEEVITSNKLTSRTKSPHDDVGGVEGDLEYCWDYLSTAIGAEDEDLDMCWESSSSNNMLIEKDFDDLLNVLKDEVIMEE